MAAILIYIPVVFIFIQTREMKYLKLAVIFVILSSCQAQDRKLLLSVEPINVMPHDTTTIEFKNWRNEFPYLDSIVISEITYLSDGLKVNGYLIEPRVKGNYPCIIYNRGGNREFGKLEIGTSVWLGHLAKNGYVVIASQYRGNGGSQGREEFGGEDVNDILNLTEVLKEVESADTSKIGMYGWSRGGMMTYIALTKTDKIKAAVVGGAVSDNFLSTKDRPSFEKNVYEELIPDYRTNKEEELTKRSAIKWANKFSKDVPILMLHGNADWRVKSEQSLKLALEFDKYRIPYKLIVFEGGDHGISEHEYERDKEVLKWFNKYLKNDEPCPNMEYHGR